jgi:hypothetical protein
MRKKLQAANRHAMMMVWVSPEDSDENENGNEAAK